MSLGLLQAALQFTQPLFFQLLWAWARHPQCQCRRVLVNSGSILKAPMC